MSVNYFLHGILFISSVIFMPRAITELSLAHELFCLTLVNLFGSGQTNNKLTYTNASSFLYITNNK